METKMIDLGTRKIFISAPYVNITSRPSKKELGRVYGLIALPRIHLLVNSIKCEEEK